MYIAFKWLTALSLTMWLALCIIDFRLKNSKETLKDGLRTDLFGWTYKNLTVKLEEISDIHDTKLYEHKYPQSQTFVLHYIMYFAGAVTVSAFNQKRQIISYTKHTIAKVNLSEIKNFCTGYLKKTATLTSVAIFKFSTWLWVISKIVLRKIKNIKFGIKTNITEKHLRLNLILINKLRDIGEERKKLTRILFAALHENKNIRIRYQLQNMAKNRLAKNIEDTQKMINENRSKYLSFQRLYLVTQQENIYLKACVSKLITEKENAEKALIEVVNEMYVSKNNALKASCSRFIVRPKDNLLNRNASDEVQKFLQSTNTSSQVSRSNNVEIIEPFCVNDRVTKVFHDDDAIIPLESNSPRLKRLPGEYIWTVKDKDGIIEKLYEYHFESDLDNGDKIRRIREYSVYYDNDRLIDVSSSRLIVSAAPLTPPTLYQSNGRFLTGSKEFLKFLQNNKKLNILPFPRSPTNPLLS